jgi:hypothetical protein
VLKQVAVSAVSGPVLLPDVCSKEVGVCSRFAVWHLQWPRMLMYVFGLAITLQNAKLKRTASAAVSAVLSNPAPCRAHCGDCSNEHPGYH